MKKTALITVGIVILLLALAVWGYLILFGTPKSTGDVFTNFGIPITTSRPVEVVTPEPTVDDNQTLVDTTGEALRQLTTRPVAGAVIVASSSVPTIRYAEVGTGHVYEINLSSGEENRLSGTTIPRVTEAKFSSSGEYVALQAVNNDVAETFAGRISTNSESNTLTGTSLMPEAENLTLDNNGNIYFSVPQQAGSTGYKYDLQNNLQTEIFTVPFTDIQVRSYQNPLYIQNDYSRWLEGNLFTITNDLLTPVLPAHFGLTTLTSDTNVILTRITNNNLLSESYNLANQTTQTLPVLTIPEKCTFSDSDTTTLWCAADIDIPALDFIEDWYKGAVTANDLLWQINLDRGEASLMADLQAVSGRTIDVTNLSYRDQKLIFVNKLDGTLWLYDTTIE